MQITESETEKLGETDASKLTLLSGGSCSVETVASSTRDEGWEFHEHVEEISKNNNRRVLNS